MGEGKRGRVEGEGLGGLEEQMSKRRRRERCGRVGWGENREGGSGEERRGGSR